MSLDLQLLLVGDAPIEWVLTEEVADEDLFDVGLFAEARASF